MNLPNKVIKKIRDNYYGPFEFFKDFPNEETCEKFLMELKYPNGYSCKSCGNTKFYKLRGKPKRARILECSGCKKQDVLVLLEKNPNGKKGRLRLMPIENKQANTIEKALIPLLKKGTTLKVDGNKTYAKLTNRYFTRISRLDQVTHWEENHEHKHLKDLNMIVGNLKRWYRGIHHSFSLKNTGYYCNEFCYRFNRRRSEVNILFRLIKRSVTRPKMLSYRQFSNEKEYMPIDS